MKLDTETKAFMATLADEAAHRAVAETLLTLGIDTHDPLEAQRDMATLRELREMIDSEDFQADLLHLRRWRKTFDSIEKKGFMAALGFIFVGGIALIIFAFASKTKILG